MSIVVQKRNSRRFKAPISGRSRGGFSLNGGFRNQGWVGQTNNGRNNCGTVFRGAFPTGNGGCCGSYVVNTQNSGWDTCCNDSTIVKRSAMNTKGLIDATIVHPTDAILQSNKACGNTCKKIWSKNMSPFAFSSGEQIKWKKISAATKMLPWSVKKISQGVKNCPNDCSAASFWIGGKHYIREPYAKDLNLFSVSPSTYQDAGLMYKKTLPTPSCLSAFPKVLNHNSSCQVNYKTPDEAKAAGVLPSNWMRCNPGCC